MSYFWESAESPLSVGEQIGHEPFANRRKFLHLTTIGIYGTPDKAYRGPHTPGDEVTRRFAVAWANLLTDYPDADVVYDDTGDSPTPYEIDVQHPKIRPGSLICWFERTFSHNVQAVVLTGSDYEFKFNATSVTKYGIYNENGTTVGVDATNGQQETWYEEEDNFRPGTPFVVTGLDESDDDGFYRVKSVRYSSSCVYVIPDNWNYEQQDLTVQAGSGGTADCDFGGDWYTLRGGDGNSLSGLMEDGGKMNTLFDALDDAVYKDGDAEDCWLTNKDMYHRYEDNAYGPNDGRPPTGGQMSCDFNHDWVRCPNPSAYYTYDVNSHRWHIKAETDGSIGDDYEQFTMLVSAHQFLCAQVDPKEIKPPVRDESGGTNTWKYGSKVQLAAAQITDAANIGANSDVQQTGYYNSIDEIHVGLSSDSQYRTAYIVPRTGNGNRTVLGTHPTGSGSPKPSWLNKKYSDALQNMVEMATAHHFWMYAVDSDYQINWIDLYEDDGILMLDIAETGHFPVYDSGETGYVVGNKVRLTVTSLQGYVCIQNSPGAKHPTDTDYWRKYSFGEALSDYDLETAWQPIINAGQKSHARMDDELWGCNSSPFELILKLLGTNYYDWYYDTTYVYRSKRILDESYSWYNEIAVPELPWTSWPETHNGITCNSAAEARDAYWPTPHGTWRRTWKRTLGKPHDAPMDKGEDTPNFDVYADYAIFPNGTRHGVEGESIKMYGTFRMEDPGEITDDTEIAGRHEETFTQDETEIYVDNVRWIIEHCRAVMNKLNYNLDYVAITHMEASYATGPSATGMDFGDLSDWLESQITSNDPDFGDYADVEDGLGYAIVGQRYSLNKSTPSGYHGQAFSVTYNALRLTQHPDSAVDLGGSSGNGRTFYVQLRCWSNNDHYDPDGNLFNYYGHDEFWGYEYSTWEPGYNNLLARIRCLTNDDNYYGLAKLTTEDAEITWNAGTGQYEYWFKLPEQNALFAGGLGPPIGEDTHFMDVQCGTDIITNEEVIIAYSWNDYIGLWDRTYEHAEFIP